MQEKTTKEDARARRFEHLANGHSTRERRKRILLLTLGWRRVDAAFCFGFGPPVLHPLLQTSDEHRVNLVGEDDAARKVMQHDLEPHIDDDAKQVIGHLEEQHEGQAVFRRRAKNLGGPSRE